MEPLAKLNRITKYSNFCSVIGKILIKAFSGTISKLENIDHFDYPNDAEVHWGHAVCDDAPNYTYIYGAGDKFPYVARAPKGDILKPWEFYTGSEFTTGIIDGCAVSVVSCSLSVGKIKEFFFYPNQGI